MHPIIRLVNRNLTISITPGFLLWQILFPLIYIFVAGFSYSSLIDSVYIQNISVNYQTYLATGMIGFNIMNSTLVSGIIIWNDRKYGMFEQILAGPFTRIDYIISNIVTISIIGISSASIILLIGFPIFFSSVVFNIFTIPLLVFVSVIGSILFGSIASIISAIIKSGESFNVIINSMFLFFAFLSTAFYPASSIPKLLVTVFYLNPLTYIADIIRSAIFNLYTDMVILEILTIFIVAIIIFVTAIKLLINLDF